MCAQQMKESRRENFPHKSLNRFAFLHVIFMFVVFILPSLHFFVIFCCVFFFVFGLLCACVLFTQLFAM